MSFDDKAYREHCDHEMGRFDNDFQAAAAISRLELPPDDRGKIDSLLAAGRWCVVEEATAYCQYTDAIIGSRKYLIADFATEGEALGHYKGLDHTHYDGEIDCQVVGPPRPEQPHNYEELPF